MRILLDTCAFLWFITADTKLSAVVRDHIADPDNEILFSVASAWEIAIKYRAGKLDLDAPPAILVPQELAANRIGILRVTMDHVLATASLPLYHRDPFDRLLVAQCLGDDLPIVTSDGAFDAYGVRRLW